MGYWSNGVLDSDSIDTHYSTTPLLQYSNFLISVLQRARATSTNTWSLYVDD
jgi:hypothetical protein